MRPMAGGARFRRRSRAASVVLACLRTSRRRVWAKSPRNCGGSTGSGPSSMNLTVCSRTWSSGRASYRAPPGSRRRAHDREHEARNTRHARRGHGARPGTRPPPAGRSTPRPRSCSATEPPAASLRPDLEDCHRCRAAHARGQRRTHASSSPTASPLDAPAAGTTARPGLDGSDRAPARDRATPIATRRRRAIIRRPRGLPDSDPGRRDRGHLPRLPPPTPTPTRNHTRTEPPSRTRPRHHPHPGRARHGRPIRHTTRQQTPPGHHRPRRPQPKDRPPSRRHRHPNLATPPPRHERKGLTVPRDQRSISRV